MADFTPIMTQEDFNTAIAARLQRERETAVKPFADYETIKNALGDAQKTLGERDATIADLSGQLKSARTDLAKTRIALAKGLPAALAGRLAGETEEELNQDADALMALIGAQSRGEPARSTEPAASKANAADTRKAALRELRENLNLGG